ncbi:MAG TPA: ATP-binding protein [Burkholderiaceae bacterium]
MLLTVLTVVVPLLAIHAWMLYSNLEAAGNDAYEDLHAKSQSAAKSVEDTISRTERLLSFVAGHDDVVSLDPVRCRGLLRGMEQIDALHAVVSILDLQGHNICASLPSVGLPPAGAGGFDWFQRALASESFHLGAPMIGRISGKPVAPMSLPVRDRGGKKVAIAVVSLDLLQLESLMVGTWQTAGGRMALLNEDLRFLVRSPDTSKWLDRRAAGTVADEFAETPAGAVRARGEDGVERIFAATELPRYTLRVSASIPTDEVLAGPRRGIVDASMVFLAALLIATLLAYLGAKRLALPVHSLAATARDIAAGDDTARADEQLPGEFRDLALEMNSMHEARMLSELRVRRVARFHEAVTRANQAILRLNGPAQLYDVICRICVETGQAHMAWIGLVRGQRVMPVAFGGAAERYMRSFPAGHSVDASTSPSLCAAAVRDGGSHVANDHQADPRMQPCRASAVQFGVRASAVVPFMQAGVVCGTLNLYADQLGFFDDELMRLLSEMGADISFALDRFAAVAVHEATVRELARRESQLWSILESSTDAIITIDANERILVFNEAAGRAFMVTAEQAVGQTLAPLIPERFRAAHARHVARFAAGDGPPLRTPRQLTGLRSDGREFPMEVTSFITRDDSETSMTLLIRDVTAKREAEQSRISAAASDASNVAKTEFLSRMSHELRTPLNAVLGFSQLLQEQAKERLTAEERHQLDLIFLAGAQLRALVDDVLDVSVIESGQLALSLSDFDLSGLLDGALRMQEALAKENAIRLIANYPPSTRITLHTDPVRLRQVMLNLLSNAIKYNRPAGTVVVDVARVPGSVRITVADTGLGMTEQQLGGLFEPFNRLGRENSAVAGTGIGMALSRHLVIAMGGELRVESQSGAGTIVTLDLPDARPLREALTAPMPVGAAPLDDPGGVVLYIEDSPVNVLVVKNVLKRWPSVRFVVAADGASGIAQAVALQPDVVLLDMRLPDMLGLDVLKTLQADARTSALKVIALSASAMPREVTLARSAGAVAYWTKPIDVPSFCHAMRAFLPPGQARPLD